MDGLLVVGYGNPLRGDDAVGQLAAGRLAQLPLGPEVTVLARHDLSPDLALDLSAVRAALFLDADALAPPGEVRLHALFPDPTLPRAPGHALSPSALLSWTRHLYGACPEAALLTVGVRTLALEHERLSDEVASGLEEMVRRALAWVEERGRSA